MNIKLYRLFGHFLGSLALLNVILGLIPVLFPVVLALSALVVALAALVLAKAGSLEDEFSDMFEAGKSGSLRSIFSKQGHDRFRSNSLTRGASRALRIGIFSVVMNALLYGVLAIHSWGCYIMPLDRELEGVREAFRKEKGQTEVVSPVEEKNN